MSYYRQINKLGVVLLIIRMLLRVAFVCQMHLVVMRSARSYPVCKFFVCIRRNEYPNGVSGSSVIRAMGVYVFSSDSFDLP